MERHEGPFYSIPGNAAESNGELEDSDNENKVV